MIQLLSVSENKRSLQKDGKTFFYLADTCWSAFTNITDEEWDYYLYKRKQQGFNTIQINILPQWDASATNLSYSPFISNDPYQLNVSYFSHAKEMCVKAKELGFELLLVVLWCNYVPNTWASKMFPGYVLPFECIENYIQQVHITFSELNPIYCISGDTDFETNDTIKYYVHAAQLLKKCAPTNLYTTHIKGRYTYIPSELLANLDFCFYQSGHNALDLSMPYSLSEEMQKKYPDFPLLNSEPCYEEMSYSGTQYGRWARKDVRRAAYVSVLSGASAGVTYGAAGIYSWHKVNMGFASSLGEGFEKPKSWEEAMAFKGAWDYGYLKTILETLDVSELQPCQDLLLNNTLDIRVAKSNNEHYFIYVPFNTNVRLNQNFDQWNLKIIDLNERFIIDGSLRVNVNETIIEMHPFSQDCLYVLTKER